MTERQTKDLESVLFALAGISSGQSSACRKAVADLEDLLRQARMATINGNVEAHRLGEQGRGFAAVVEALTGLIEKIEASACAVRLAAEESRQMNDQLVRLGRQVAGQCLSPSGPSSKCP